VDPHALPALLPALPELWLCGAALALLMIGVFGGDRSTRPLCYLAIAALLVTFVLLLLGPEGRTVTFSGMFVVDPFGVFTKGLVLIGAMLAIVLSLGYIRHEGMERFEFPVLIVLATVGMLLMISANDLIALYLGLEMQSLALYVIAAFRRDSLRSTEAGLKYFVLGALASGMLLYGASLVYGFTGTTSFEDIARAVSVPGATDALGTLVGLVFILAGLAFKVSAVPFHMWTPDVYEGAPTPVTALFAVAPKVAAIGLFLRVMLEPFAALAGDWQQVIVVISIASMVLGALAAIRQTSIKRLMAYSSIGHMGYALIGLAAGSAEGVRGVLIYLAIYVVMNVGTFAVILCMRRGQGMVEDITELAGLSRTHPMLALAMTVFMFSLAGVPPLAGFFGKLYVFMAAIHAELYGLAVVGVVASVVGAYYYVRIVKLMYFDAPTDAFERPIRGEMAAVLVATGVLTALFFVYPAPLLAGAATAAAALVP